MLFFFVTFPIDGKVTKRSRLKTSAPKNRWEKSDSFTLEFKEIPTEDFYKELDACFDSYESGQYSFSAIWGNGIEAPKGESNKYDGTFRLEIETGSKIFSIDAGTW